MALLSDLSLFLLNGETVSVFLVGEKVVLNR